MGCHGGKVVVCTDDGQVSLMRSITTVQMASPMPCPICLSLSCWEGVSVYCGKFFILNAIFRDV